MATKKATTDKSAVDNKVVTLKVIREFVDKTNGEYRKTDSFFEASQARAKELVGLGFCKKA